ncbi:MAG: AAA family ATPase [bacterium]
MLTKVHIKGYKSLADVEVELRPLNVLIGPNGGGKSTFVDTFVFLYDVIANSLDDAVYRRGGSKDLLYAGAGQDSCIEFDYRIENLAEHPSSYFLKLRPHNSSAVVAGEYFREHRTGEDWQIIFRLSGKTSFQSDIPGSYKVVSDMLRDSSDVPEDHLAISFYGNEPAIRYLREYFLSWTSYPGLDVSPDSKTRQPQLIRHGLALHPRGDNLASVLHNIKEKYPEEWQDIVETIEVAYPRFDRIAFPAEGGDGRINLRWFEKPFDKHEGFSINLLSDGILRFLCLVAILMSPEPPPLILIDEPEIGLHPHFIRLVAELMQNAAEKTQLIVATHSPELISALEPEDVLVVESRDGATFMERLSGTELEKWLDQFGLGELWVTGHLGGNP